MVTTIDGMRDNFESGKARALKHMTMLQEISKDNYLRMVNDDDVAIAYLNNDGLFIKADMIVDLTVKGDS